MKKTLLEELKDKYANRGYVFHIPVPLDHNIGDDSNVISNVGENVVDNTKKVLLLSHQMSLTGAPYALLSAAKILKNQRDEVGEIVVATAEAGALTEVFLTQGIGVVEIPQYWNRAVVFKSFVKNFDIVIVNTVLNFPACMILSDLDVKVYWWIHEHEHFFSYGRGEIPNPGTLGTNITVLAVSPYVASIIKKEFDYDAELFPIVVDDVYANKEKSFVDMGVLHFYCSGTFSHMKGQDILIQAYAGLPVEYKEKLKISFIGGENHSGNEYYEIVKQLAKREKNIEVLNLVERDEMMELFSRSHGCIIPSRYEPLPTVAIEVMLLGRCVVASNATGISFYMEEGKTGYIFEKDNVEALREKLKYVVDHRGELQSVGQRSKVIHQKIFCEEVFVANLQKMISD